MNELKRAVEEIKMPDEVRKRIIRRCREERKTGSAVKKLRSKGLAALVAVVCLCLAAVVGAAGSGGFFRNILRWDGAVTGTEYEQASDEIELTAEVSGGELTVTAIMLKSDDVPYSELESLGVGSFRITGEDGRTVFEGGPTEMCAVDGGRAEIKIPLPDMAAGNYTLYVDAFTGGAKADQPLTIRGEWICTFDANP